ncbi:hypothetical protein BDV93DRAFT_520710 [Ceratobasidium sp. AG-I]|nr:hypothetical protein BDV93DRAFT_520710 [Ceratobasidium sp. AG-I]
MRVVEAFPTDAATSSGNDDSLPHVDGRHYDEDYDEEEVSGTAVEGLDEGGEDEEYEEEEYDPEAEAEAVARELGNQIWAELGQNIGTTDKKTNGENEQDDIKLEQTSIPEGLGTTTETKSTPTEPPQESAPPTNEIPPHHPQYSHPPTFLPPTPDPMIETIKTMLSLALSDPHVHYALMTTIVPGPVANGANLYAILTGSVMEGRVNPELAQPLSILISALASGSMMVAAEPPQYPPAPATIPSPSHGLDPSGSPLKRKREPADEGHTWPAHPIYNPAVQPLHPIQLQPQPQSQPPKSQPSEDLLNRLQSATSDILQVLDPLLESSEPLSESAVTSIQRQLHQVYSFASTCPQQQPEDSSMMQKLQEIGGLIQVVGILSGVPIAQSSDTDAAGPSTARSGASASRTVPNAIGTAIHPCTACPKMFNKLSALRTHERTHSEGRPYKCEYAGCPASFARNHDLRRHEKSHERQMFRCRGCDRLFSRRDALRRHKTNEKALDECREAPMDTSTVQHDGDPPRVTRVWQNHPEAGDWPRESDIEDGEIRPDAVTSAQHAVVSLHMTLQRHVTKGLNPEPSDVTTDQPSEPTFQAEQRELEEPLQAVEPAPAPLDNISEIDDRTTATPTTAANITTTTQEDNSEESRPALTLPGYGLDDEHASLLERAIAVAAQAAQAQAEAEAALFGESYDEEEQDDGEWNEGEEEPGRELGADADMAKLVY